MNTRRLLALTAAVPLAGTALLLSVPANAAPDPGDSLVTSGSPNAPFPRNKQNEPAVGAAVDPANYKTLVAGANEEIDNAPCDGSDCSFTPGISDNGIYFSFDAGKTWKQPTYTGWSARTGTGKVGPIGAVPNYYEADLVGDGDPALAFGPRPGPNGFSWSNGSRLYYASLASNFPDKSTFDADEAISISYADDLKSAAAGHNSAWSKPVIASHDLEAGVFDDKEAVWADNAASSAHFGTVYTCWTSFRPDGTSPIVLSRSTDGGKTYSTPTIVFNAVATLTTGPSGCAIRTDSLGRVYVAFENITDNGGFQMLARSYNGGKTFEPARNVASVTPVGKLDPAHVAVDDPRFTMDGLAGARAGESPSLDIANGAPTGNDATNEVVLAWSDGRKGLNHEEALITTSMDRGSHWAAPIDAKQSGDRPNFTAAGIAPNGHDIYLTYDAFLAPWRETTSTARPMQGVVRQAEVTSKGMFATFVTLHRGQVGDARGSSQNDLTSEFLGDYNYVSAVRSFGAAVWNDVRHAAVCDAVNKYRQSLITANPLPKPSPLKDCPKQFGNTDIYGGSYVEP